MNNREAVERFEQAHSAKLENLFWIAGALENDKFKEIIEDDMSDKDFAKCFPAIFNSKSYTQYRNESEMMQAFVDFKLFGLFAEIHIPRAYNFTYKAGKPVSWSSSAGSCRIAYVYAETMESVMVQIELASEEIFQEYIKAEKKRAKV